MNLLYPFVKYTGRIGLPLFFGKLEINGRENIPKDLPYLIAPNHQNAFLDAIIMGVYNDKPVHFLTRSDVFIPPFTAALEALNMMPIYRIRDGYDQLSKNESVFATCERLLSEHQPVLIFPEGNMDKHHYLRPLTKGTARLAFQSQKKLSEDLMILPVGINYFDHYRPRHKCIVNFGRPIRVRDYLAIYEQQAAKGLIALRNELSDCMKELLLIPAKGQYSEEVLALNYKNEKFTFEKLRELIKQQQFNKAKYNAQLSWLAKGLTFLNPLAILLVHYILKVKVTHSQFRASIKYTLGLLLSVIWWIILFIMLLLFTNWKFAILGTLISIIGLFVRSELKKRASAPII